MPPKFGTSGLRGLVTELTDDLVGAHVAAFAATCDTGGRLALGRDLRSSSPRIAAAVAAAAAGAGLDVTDLGEICTPALALAAQDMDAGAIMVTGSHIPDDRNGLKFYTRAGEIAKTDEAAISAAVDAPAADHASSPTGGPVAGRPADAHAAYRDRYLTAFGPGALSGLSVGLYQHSSVARDVLGAILEGLGARILPLGRSDRFIPVDTEAVPPETRAQLAAWASARSLDAPLDAIVSADGDGDRPLLTDAAGRVVPGDLLGLLAARHLGADTVVTPVSSTTALELSGAFAVRRTRIGSPHVIAGIAEVLSSDPGARVVGFEANGGFLLGWPAPLPGGTLAPLMTRDAALPLVAALAAAQAGGGLATLLSALPARATAADRLQGIDTDAAAALVSTLSADAAARADLLGRAETAMDLTDGVRLAFATPDGDEIIHLRPSGNAPEMRCYAEACTASRADDLVARTLALLSRRLPPA